MSVHLMLVAWYIVGTGAEPVPFPLDVVSARPRPDVTKWFQRTDGWTGGDGAYSVPIGKDRTLWMFGDSWIGAIEDGRRIRSRMVNNTFAWQSLKDPNEPLRFIWSQHEGEPAAVLRPDSREDWYWPGCAELIDGKLYIFCKVVRRREEGAPGFQFDWFADELLQIANPVDEPTAWRIERRARIPEAAPRLGVACIVDGEYLYAYGLHREKARKPFHSPLAVARIKRKSLAAMDMTAWQFRTSAGWSDAPKDLATLYADAPPEMTVCRLRGIDGLLAVYTAYGLGGDIMARHAGRPEGPWSRPVRLYRCPEVTDKLLLYGAKAHPELATADGQLILTYCRNIGSLTEHVRRPDIYVPQGVEVRLGQR
jgi:hypothetical protein